MMCVWNFQNIFYHIIIYSLIFCLFLKSPSHSAKLDPLQNQFRGKESEKNWTWVCWPRSLMKCVADQGRQVWLHPRGEVSFPMCTRCVTSLPQHLFWGLVIDKYYVNELVLHKGGKQVLFFNLLKVWLSFFSFLHRLLVSSKTSL